MKLMRLKPGFAVVLRPELGVEKLEVLIGIHGDPGSRPPDSDVLALVALVPMDGEKHDRRKHSHMQSQGSGFPVGF